MFCVDIHIDTYIEYFYVDIDTYIEHGKFVCVDIDTYKFHRIRGCGEGNVIR